MIWLEITIGVFINVSHIESIAMAGGGIATITLTSGNIISNIDAKYLREKLQNETFVNIIRLP